MKIIQDNSFYVKELNIYVSMLNNCNNNLIYYKKSRDKKYLESKNLRFLTEKEISIISKKLKIINNKLYYNSTLLIEEKKYYYEDEINYINFFIIRYDNRKNKYLQLDLNNIYFGEGTEDEFNFPALVTKK